MITLLADANINGHVARLGFLMRSPYWRDVWDGLQIRVATFADVGLDPADTDAVVWHCCQTQRLLLITSNRNEDAPDSLGATIRMHSTATSLPVFTLSDADEVLRSGDYADQVAETLYEYLLELDTIRGTGRLYLP